MNGGDLWGRRHFSCIQIEILDFSNPSPRIHIAIELIIQRVP